jgi:hypothetical protein
MRLETQRREARTMEALQSPKWESKLVAEHNLRWLKDKNHMNSALPLKDAAGVVLHRMVLDGQFASQICKMLDLWKAWADNGGMRRSDYNALQDDQVAFAMASLLLAMIKDTISALAGTISVDLQECLSIWKVVRLG